MHPKLEELYLTENKQLLNSGISVSEGQFLSKLIRDHEFTHTIEIGCAFGFSSMFICEAIASRSSAHHTIIDPFQKSDFNGQGIKNLNQAGFKCFELLEERSEFILPKFVQDGKKFDFALIDGCHTFDHTLVDFFYLNRLLKVGGIIVFDDVNMVAVNKVAKHVLSYPCYEFVGAVNERGWQRKGLNALKFMLSAILYPITRLAGSQLSHEIFDNSIVRPAGIKAIDYATMVAFRKTSEDNRGCIWHQYF